MALEEAMHMLAFKHDNIIQQYFTSWYRHGCFIFMEYADGEDLYSNI